VRRLRDPTAPSCQGNLTGMGAWQDGRRAWERLDGWDEERTAASARDGGAALAALADIGTVRRLLDQAELVSVKVARASGKSWAEIATKLGVTRQSAWERWRDLDETAPAAAPAAGPVEQVRDRAAEAMVIESAGRRRQATVVVPDVIGRSWDAARERLAAAGLVGVAPDPDGAPVHDGTVTDQSPESGATVPPGSPVTLWVERGGGAGVREPRRPTPRPRAGRALSQDVG
jgi:hypothetical protein